MAISFQPPFIPSLVFLPACPTLSCLRRSHPSIILPNLVQMLAGSPNSTVKSSSKNLPTSFTTSSILPQPSFDLKYKRIFNLLEAYSETFLFSCYLYFCVSLFCNPCLIVLVLNISSFTSFEKSNNNP